MRERRVWTEDKLNEAAQLWDAGLTAAKIAETLGVTLGSFLGTSSLKRELFPVRMKPKGEAEVEAEEVPEPVMVAEAATEEPKPAVRHTYIDGRWIEHVKRTTQSGAVVTMPRVSFIDGVREGG